MARLYSGLDSVLSPATSVRFGVKLQEDYHRVPTACTVTRYFRVPAQLNHMITPRKAFLYSCFRVGDKFRKVKSFESKELVNSMEI